MDKKDNIENDEKDVSPEGGKKEWKPKWKYESQRSSDLFEHYRFVADPGQSVIRIDKFLMDKVEKVTRSKLQSAIRDGAIKVNGNNIKPNHKIRPNDVVTILLPNPPEVDVPVTPENIPLDIIYEDDDVMVINKPAGMVVHPGVGHVSGTLVNALSWYLREQGSNLPFKDGYVSRPGLVHRIDKDTSGLLVTAKNEYAMSHLSNQFFRHTIHRRYWALVWGGFDGELEGTLKLNIGRDPYNRLHQRVFPEGDMGKYACTHYKVLEDLYYVSLVECALETGRTHQIRVHMKYLGHTLFNDAKYGGDQILKGTVFSKYKQFVDNAFKLMPRQALHAKSLGFVHPKTGEQMMFEVDLPDDFAACIEKWRKYLSSRKS